MEDYMQEKPWYKNYDEGVPTHLDYPKVPLYRFLEDAAKK
jgi:long-chain acyl-CoA synthetase